MWTLLTESTQLCCGLFPSQVEAEMWASQFLQGVRVRAIELLLQSEHAEILRDNELFTNDSTPIHVC